MSFISIEPLNFANGPTHLTNVVRVRSDGSALQVVVAGDVSEKFGFKPGERAFASIGAGSHAGKLALQPAPADALGTYKVQKSGKGSQVSIGAAHFGFKKRAFKTMNVSFEVSNGMLILALPTEGEVVKHLRPVNSGHAVAA